MVLGEKEIEEDVLHNEPQQGSLLEYNVMNKSYS